MGQYWLKCIARALSGSLSANLLPNHDFNQTAIILNQTISLIDFLFSDQVERTNRMEFCYQNPNTNTNVTS